MTAALRFFGGKGGVGKTTCSAATALRLAEGGERVLLVSTDPAHSLADALGTKLTASPRKVAGTLWALELDAPAALQRWLAPRRAALARIAEHGTYFDRAEIERLLDLSFPGVDELIALLEILRLTREGKWDRVVVDTAPTGHTLRLLAMPESLRKIAEVLDEMQARHRVLIEALSRSRGRRQPEDDVISSLHDEADELFALLRDSDRTRIDWVTLPEDVVVQETLQALADLGEQGLRPGTLWVNRVTPAPRGRCALCEGRRRMEALALARLAEKDVPPLRQVGALDEEPVGVKALRRFGAAMERARPVHGESSRAARHTARGESSRATPDLLPALWPPSLRLLFFGGKGGVGKSTTAAATALALARARPHDRVLLLSTDPAHSLGHVLGMDAGDDERPVPSGPANLTVRELDAKAQFEVRKDDLRLAVDELFDDLRGDSRFDAVYDRAIVRDLIDCAPPGVDEIFALLSLTDAVLAPPGSKERRDLVVIDTAPTGHAIRLLEMPEVGGAWVRALLELLLHYRQVTGLGRLAQELVDASRRLRSLQALLTDAGATRFALVMRPAALPRDETLRLLKDLRRLRVAPGGLFVNHLTPADGCARCKAAAKQERAQVDALVGGARNALRAQVGPVIFAPAVAPPPQGAVGLQRWTAGWTRYDARAAVPATRRRRAPAR